MVASESSKTCTWRRAWDAAACAMLVPSSTRTSAVLEECWMVSLEEKPGPQLLESLLMYVGKRSARAVTEAPAPLMNATLVLSRLILLPLHASLKRALGMGAARMAVSLSASARRYLSDSLTGAS